MREPAADERERLFVASKPRGGVGQTFGALIVELGEQVQLLQARGGIKKGGIALAEAQRGLERRDGLGETILREEDLRLDLREDVGVEARGRGGGEELIGER